MKSRRRCRWDKFGYRATPPERTWGRANPHITEANVNQNRTPRAEGGGPGHQHEGDVGGEILKALADSFDYGTAALNEQTDQTMVEAATNARFGWLHGAVGQSARRLLRHRPHLGHLRADGRLSSSQRRHHAASQTSGCPRTSFLPRRFGFRLAQQQGFARCSWRRSHWGDGRAPSIASPEVPTSSVRTRGRRVPSVEPTRGTRKWTQCRPRSSSME